jgi:hypothetical protein
MFRKLRQFFNFIGRITLKPFNLIKGFFIYLHKKIRPILNKTVNKSRIIDNINKIIGSERGYYDRFMKFHTDGCTISELNVLYKKIKSHRQYITRNINEFETYEDINNYIDNQFIKSKINQIIKDIPSKVRKNYSEHPIFIKCLTQIVKNNFGRYDDIKEYVGKNSLSVERYTNSNVGYNDFNSTVSYFSEMGEEFSSYYKYMESKKKASYLMLTWLINFLKPNDKNDLVKEIDPRLILINDVDSLLVRCDTFETLKKIGSPNWCIYKTKSTFESYTSGVKEQYVYINYSENIFCGITTAKQNFYEFNKSFNIHTITNSHNYKNDTFKTSLLPEIVLKKLGVSHMIDDSYEREVINFVNQEIKRFETKFLEISLITEGLFDIDFTQSKYTPLDFLLKIEKAYTICNNFLSMSTNTIKHKDLCSFEVVEKIHQKDIYISYVRTKIAEIINQIKIYRK